MRESLLSDLNIKQNRYILLDIFRSLAISLVLIAHISQTTHYFLGDFFGIKGFYFVTLGGFAVTIFLVLSGIVLELVYYNQRIRYISFIKKRILRLFPVYYISLLISLFLMLAYAGLVHKLPERITSLNITDIFLMLTSTYVFIGEWGGPLLPTSWFLGLIISMYLLFPFLSVSMHRHPHIMISILLLTSILARLILGQNNLLPYRPLDWFPLCRIFEFGFGIYLGKILSESVWKSCDNISERIRDLIIFMSKVSFPLFLIHYPLKPIITILSQKIPLTFCIIIYLLIATGISCGVMMLDNHIQRLFKKRKKDSCNYTTISSVSIPTSDRDN